MKKTIILVGKTASGKSTTAKILEETGYHRILTDTTRPKRAYEVDGIDYHFRTQEQFQKLAQSGYYAEYVTVPTSFGYQSYGSSKDSYKTGEKAVIVLNPDGLREVNQSIAPGYCVSVYLEVDEKVLIKRLHARGDDEAEIEHRLKQDAEDFVDISKECDYTLHLDGTETPKSIANRIRELVEQEPNGINLAICLDDKNGMMFNHRRQSQDSAVRTHLLQRASELGGLLLMTPYTAKQFQGKKNIKISDEPWKFAAPKDLVFMEETNPALLDCKFYTIVVYHWNRVYPSDVKCTLDFRDYILADQSEFSGNSHEKITCETYRR